METVRQLELGNGLVTVDVTFESDEPQRIRRIAARNNSPRSMVGRARDRNGEWERYDLGPGQAIDRNIPGNRRVPIAELVWTAQW